MIIHALTLLDGAAHQLAERRQHRGESVDVLPAAPGLHGVFGQRRSLGDRTRCALDAPAQLDGALGDQIDVVLHVLVHLVEELMQGNEMGALDVPMRLLRLRLQIDGIGEPRVAQVDHLPPRRFR